MNRGLYEVYSFTNGAHMRRDPEWPHRWILRNAADEEIDRDQYRLDLISRNNLSVREHYDPFASVDRNPEGEDPQGLRAEHESAVAKPDARKGSAS